MQALDEAGLRFQHGDGTSGGIFTLGMLLSGMGWRAIIPWLLIGLPRAYGCWHMVMTGREAA